jgi:hypothetical protein
MNSLDDIIRIERGKVKRLVPIYRWKERKNLVLAYDQMIDNCIGLKSKGPKTSRKAAEVVGITATRTKDPNITLEVCRTLKLYVDGNGSDEIISLIEHTTDLCEDYQAITSLSNILQSCCNRMWSNINPNNELQKLSRLVYTKDHEPLIAFANLLDKYAHSMDDNIIKDLVFDVFKDNMSEQQFMGVITFLDKHLENKKNFDQESSKNIKSYLDKLYFLIDDEELSYSLSGREMKIVDGAYQITSSTCQNWPEEYQNVAMSAFFDKLNDNVSTGKNLQDKRRILKEYCNNVTRLVRDNAEGLRFTQPYEHPTTQPAKRLSGVSVE